MEDLMPKQQLTNGELLILEQLWKLGEASPEEVQNSLRNVGKEVTGGTVRKMLFRLFNKEYVIRTKKSHKYIYEVKEKPEATRRMLLQDLMNRAFDGSASLIMAALFKDNALHDDDLKEVVQMITAYRKEHKNESFD